MNTSQIKNFAIQSRSILKTGVLNRILMLGFNDKGELIVDRPIKIQGGTVFMDQLREESFYDAWIALEARLAKHGIKEVCEEAAYTWFNRLVAIRIMQKNHFIEPVMQYVSQETRIPVIVDQARSGRLSLPMTAQDRAKLDDLLKDSTKTNEQFNLLISAFCHANPVIFNCFGGIERHIALLLPDNILSHGGFIDLLNNASYLTDEDYTKSELIGWLYQFYISEKKDEVFDGFKKGKKAEAKDIPAATQIFTPNWIVKYMVENTVGRIYLENNPYADDIKASMKYLMEPAEPTPEDAILKIDDLTEYKMIDAACGSGHILIEGFNLFYRMYIYEGYAPCTAIDNIFRKNIIGLDLDPRAKQLATFALLMTAAKLDKSFLDCKVMPRILDFPEPFVYRGGAQEDFFQRYFSGCSRKIIDETIKAFELMEHADNLGSIMKFDISPETRAAIEKSTDEWEMHEFVNPDIKEAISSMKIILALTDSYTAAVMNPPYMGSNNMNDSLKSYIERQFYAAKNDLMTVFMTVASLFTVHNGRWAMIDLPSWMFLSSFEQFRISLIEGHSINSLLHLGRGIFGSDFGSVSFVIHNTQHLSKGCYRRLFKEHVQVRSVEEIERLFLNPNYGAYYADQREYSQLPGHPLAYWVSKKMLTTFSNPLIGDYGTANNGFTTGDNNRFLRLWFEVSCKNISYSAKSISSSISSNMTWFPYNKGGAFRKWYGNNDFVINWYNNGQLIKAYGHLVGRSMNYQFKESISWSKISAGAPSFKLKKEGTMFDVAGLSLFPKNESLFYFLLGLCNSVYSRACLKFLSPTVNYETGHIASIPVVFNDGALSVINPLVKDCVRVSSLDWDAHETSWDFRKSELLRAQSLCLKNGANMDMLPTDEIEDFRKTVPYDGRKIDHCIRAYKNDWERNFNQLHSNEEELNRQFIEIYGLQDELTPDVPLNEISILQNGEISIEDNQIVWHEDVIVQQFISYAIGCWMGRYRLDQEGLYIAYYPTDDEVCTYQYNGDSFEIDDDAIIPIMGGNNPFEDDNALQKIINFVKIVFGEENLTKNLNYIEHCLGKSLENYLIKDFWKDHKKMYQNRPIYWLFSSKKGAFQVLTYMHRMNPYTVEKIRTKYLLPYIDYLKGRIEVDEARGSELSSVERANLAKMRVALDECNEYHDRLHEIAIQAIDFDLDDGVVVNYAKFGDVVAKIK